jgi:hypothetical protein
MWMRSKRRGVGWGGWTWNSEDTSLAIGTEEAGEERSQDPLRSENCLHVEAIWGCSYVDDVTLIEAEDNAKVGEMGSAGDSLSLADGFADLVSAEESKLRCLQVGKAITSRGHNATCFVVNKVSEDGSAVRGGSESHVVEGAVTHREGDADSNLIFVERSCFAVNRERGAQREIWSSHDEGRKEDRKQTSELQADCVIHKIRVKPNFFEANDSSRRLPMNPSSTRE